MAYIYRKLHHTKPLLKQKFAKSRIPFTLDFCLCRQIKYSHYPHNAPAIGGHLQTGQPATVKKRRLCQGGQADWEALVYAGDLPNEYNNC